MMIRPFLYDLKRTLTSKSVLIITAIILLISLTIIPLATPRTTSLTSTSNVLSVLYYYDSGAFHFLVFTEDQFGNAISQSGISLNLSNYQGSFNQTVPVQTDSSGMGTATITAPNTGYYLLQVSLSSGSSKASFGSSVSIVPQGIVTAFQGSALTIVTDKSNASKRDLQVIFAGAYGSLPTSYSVYYKVTPAYATGNFNRTQMTFFQNLTSYERVFDLPFLSGVDPQNIVWIAIFKNGSVTAVETPQEFGYEMFRPTRFVPVATDVGSFFFAGILSFFVPLVAVIGSYSSYGKDRITGVLESVLARPVTRRSLAISRFLSTILAITIATIASVGIVDLILGIVTGSTLSSSYILAIIAGLVVEIAAFTGLVFLFSHLFKSTGSLLGLSIGLFIFLDFFWNFIVFLLAAVLGGTLGSAVYLQATIISYYANPAQFLNLVNIFFFQSTNGLAIQGSNYGLTLPTLVFVGIVWSVAPFIIFLYLAVKRD